MKSKNFTIIVLLLALTSILFADAKLPAVISDHMVLQQNSKANIWGWAEPGEKIEVKGSWQWLFGSSTTTDKDGNWHLAIPTPKAGGPYEINIKANNTIAINDVMIGEVWVCSGQSNMEMGMKMVENSDTEIAAADYPNIRLFDVARQTSSHPNQDLTGSWVRCSPETVASHGTWGGFSATAYYFGRQLHKELNVPVGLISSNWGGTVAQAWTPGDMLGDFPEYDQIAKELKSYNLQEIEKRDREKMNEWQNKVGQTDLGSKQGWERVNFDDSEWKTMDQPVAWSKTELDDFDGVVWFRKYTNLPPSWANKDLIIELGPIDDIDTVYFNGQQIGQNITWSVKRKYTVPASVSKVGKNLIAIRVIDGQSEGGMCGKPEQMIIYPAGASVDSAATLAGSWKYKVSSHIKEVPPTPTLLKKLSSNTPSVLYNGMIAPLVPYTIKGAIWYQGESNAQKPIEYRSLFPNMVESWREKWGIGDFPFYYVQIAPYHYKGQDINSAMLREAQTFSMSTPNTGMVVVSDIGDNDDIHPKNKLDVGKRLSLWALAKTYNKKGITYSGPIYKDMKIEGDKIRVSFDYTGSGLMAKGGPLTDFTIAGPDKNFVDATAVIDGDTIVVSSDSVPNPVAVRFAFTNTNNPNLFNKEGLPASSFRTDDWKE